ncbi:Helix-turn-helix domain protein [compost metagenome]
MAHTTQPNRRIHEGRNIKRFREMLGMKQDALAADLGHDWNQQRVSLLEQRETIELDVLQQIAAVLHLPVEAIQNFDEEQAVNVIANTFTDFKDSASAINIQPVFNPIEAILNMHNEKMALYERMLNEKDEMMERLEKLINK